MEFNKINIGGGDTGKKINISRRINLINTYAKIENKYILDCGCGNGMYLKKLCQFSNNVYGIEYSKEKIEKYKTTVFSTNNVVQGNVEEMPFDQQKFDLVLLNEVLEHIPNQKMALKEIYRILKNDGYLIVMTPNRFYPFETHSIIYKSKKWTIPHYIPLIPYIPHKIGDKFFEYLARNYFYWELKKLIKDNGFLITNHTYISQTFEGIGGLKNKIYVFIGPILRKVFFNLEKIKYLKILFCSTQVIISKKN